MRTPKLAIYRDGRREWRWRLKASNGRIMADSGEGYRRRASRGGQDGPPEGWYALPLEEE